MKKLNVMIIPQIMVLSSLNSKRPLLTVDLFEDELDFIEQDELLNTLQDLSVLELSLLIAMKHHSEIYDNQPMNFEMIFARYMKFVNSNANVQTVKRDVVMKAYEHLHNLELIAPVSNSGRLQKEYQMFKLLVTGRQITDAVKKSHGLPTEVTQWVNSSLV